MVQYSEPEMCKMFHALGDTTRMAMVQRLCQGDVVASELSKPLNITLTATLKHLKILEEAGLTRTVKVGRERHCSMQWTSLADIEKWIEETRKAWNYRLDRLGEFLDQEDSNP